MSVRLLRVFSDQHILTTHWPLIAHYQQEPINESMHRSLSSAKSMKFLNGALPAKLLSFKLVEHYEVFLNQGFLTSFFIKISV